MYMDIYIYIYIYIYVVLSFYLFIIDKSRFAAEFLIPRQLPAAHLSGDARRTYRENREHWRGAPSVGFCERDELSSRLILEPTEGEGVRSEPYNARGFALTCDGVPYEYRKKHGTR